MRRDGDVSEATEMEIEEAIAKFKIDGSIKLLRTRIKRAGQNDEEYEVLLRHAGEKAVLWRDWRASLIVMEDLWRERGMSTGGGVLENMLAAQVRLGRAEGVTEFMDELAFQGGDRVIFNYPSDPALAIEKSELAMQRRLPAITIFTMPKSASVYIWLFVSDLLDLPRTRISGTLFGIDNVAPQWAKILSRRPSICQQHVAATQSNIRALEDAGINRIVVHVRDPRQAVLSWLHHTENERRRGKSYTLVREHDPSYLWSSFESKLSTNIQSYLPEFVGFAQSWMEIADDTHSKIKVLFTCYESMISNESAFFERILDFYDIDTSPFDLQSFIRERPSLIKGLYHFRKGQTEEWREVFSDQQKRLCLELIPDALSEFYGWGP